MCQEQSCNKSQGKSKDDIPDPPYLLPWLLRHFIRQEVQNHRSPAGIAAPSASENQRSEYLCHGIVDSRSFEDTREQVIPKSLYLHVLVADKSQIDQHISTYKKLDYASGMLVPADEQEHSQSNRAPDVAEVEEIENVVLCKPKSDGYRLEYQQHDYGCGVFLHVNDSSILRGKLTDWK